MFDDQEKPIFTDKRDFLKEEVSEGDICFWIDPLDGTASFVYGYVQAVTCNIGVTYKGFPIFGTIGKPFPYSDRPNMVTTFVGGL